MSSKIIIFVIAQVFLIKIAYCQVINRIPGAIIAENIPIAAANIANINSANYANTIGPEAFAALYPQNGLSTSSGGSFVVTSSSPILPTGISIIADNLVLDGALAVKGNMPFMGTVGLDGSVPIGGQGSVLYNCGNGNVGIVSEGLANANLAGMNGPLNAGQQINCVRGFNN